MYGQYCRIESRAGGVSCSRREFIRAALSMIKKRSRFSRKYRDNRHVWIREGLEMHEDGRRQYAAVCGGYGMNS